MNLKSIFVTQIIITSSLIDNTNSKSRAKMFGANYGISMISGVFGNIFGGIIGDFWGLKQTIILALLIKAISLLFINKIPKTPYHKAKFEFDANQKFVIFYYLSSSTAIGFGAGLFIHFGNLIFKDLFNMSTALIGVVLAISQLSTGIGSILSPKMGKFFGPSKLLVLSHSLVVPLMLMVSLIREPIAFTALYSARFMIMNMVSPIITVLVFSSLPNNTISTINGLNNLFNNVARAFATYLYGHLVTSLSGYKTLFLMSTVFYAANAILTFTFYKRIRGSKLESEMYN